MEPSQTDATLAGEGFDSPSLDRLQAWLVLLPLAVLCFPGELLSLGGGALSPFQGAPDTTSIGVGITALSAIPAALLATLLVSLSLCVPFLLFRVIGTVWYNYTP